MEICSGATTLDAFFGVKTEEEKNWYRRKLLVEKWKPSAFEILQPGYVGHVYIPYTTTTVMSNVTEWDTNTQNDITSRYATTPINADLYGTVTLSGI